MEVYISDTSHTDNSYCCAFLSLGVDCRKLDVMDSAAVQAFAASIPKVDVLFNCAGYAPHFEYRTNHSETGYNDFSVIRNIL